MFEDNDEIKKIGIRNICLCDYDHWIWRDGEKWCIVCGKKVWK